MVSLNCHKLYRLSRWDDFIQTQRKWTPSSRFSTCGTAAEVLTHIRSCVVLRDHSVRVSCRFALLTATRLCPRRRAVWVRTVLLLRCVVTVTKLFPRAGAQLYVVALTTHVVSTRSRVAQYSNFRHGCRVSLASWYFVVHD